MFTTRRRWLAGLLGASLLLSAGACSVPQGRRSAPGPNPEPPAPEGPPPRCAMELAEVPLSWRPPSRGPAPPWSAEERRAAEEAVAGGLAELKALYRDRPETVAELADNSVESLLDLSYSASNLPELAAEARREASLHLKTLVEPHVAADRATPSCDQAAELLTLMVYAAQLWSTQEPLEELREVTAEATAACGSLAEMMGYDPDAVLSGPDAPTGDELYDLVMWSITLEDAALLKGVTLPEGSEDLLPRLWPALQKHALVGPEAYEQGANDWTFYDTAYLATHIPYILTGYGRYGLSPEEAPWVFAFLRASFYAVLEMGELDLVAEYVDLFRQTGCTETNDRQVLDGTRQLMAQYRSAKGRWMDYREPYETAESNAYDLAHKAWTGVAGVRHRVPERPTPGSYGQRVRRVVGP